MHIDVLHMCSAYTYIWMYYTCAVYPYTVKKRGVTEHPRGAIFYCFHTVTTETVKYCSPGVFSYTAFFTMYIHYTCVVYIWMCYTCVVCI